MRRSLWWWLPRWRVQRLRLRWRVQRLRGLWLWRLRRMRRLRRMWRLRLLLGLWGLRGLLGVCRMCRREVGRRAATDGFLSASAAQAAIESAEAAAQGRRRIADRGAPQAGPTTHRTGNARADVAFASSGRAGTGPGLNRCRACLHARLRKRRSGGNPRTCSCCELGGLYFIRRSRQTRRDLSRSGGDRFH
jgi:hypothetical protein